MINPYIVGPPVFGTDFYGRQQLTQDLLDPRQTCVYLVGCRRSGKTSMLHHLEKQTTAIPLFLDLLRTGAQATGIRAELVREIKRQTLRHPILSQVDLTAADECQLIESLALITEQQGQCVLLLWDEAEKLLEVDEQRLGCLRSTLQHKPQLQTILAATKQLNKLGLQTSAAWTFLDGFATCYLPPLTDQEAETLIRQLAGVSPVQVEVALVAEIAEVTGRQPYLIQLLCHRLFDGNGGLRAITEEDLVVSAGLGDIFQTDYEALLSSERSILLTLAKRGRAGVTDLQKSLSIQVDQLRSYLLGLHEIGLIDRNSSDYYIASHFLRIWLGIDRAQETRAITSDAKGLKRSEDRGRALSAGERVAHQLEEARTNLRLIEERAGTYVLSTDVPLQLRKEEARLRDYIAQLEDELHPGA